MAAGSAIYEARLQLQGIDQATGDAIAKFNLFVAGMVLAVVAVTRKPRINGYAAAACLGLAVLSFAVGAAVTLQRGPFGDIPIGLAFALVLGAVAFGPRSSLLVRFLAAGTSFLVERPALLGAAWLGQHPPPIRGIRGAEYAML